MQKRKAIRTVLFSVFGLGATAKTAEQQIQSMANLRDAATALQKQTTAMSVIGATDEVAQGKRGDA